MLYCIEPEPVHCYLLSDPEFQAFNMFAWPCKPCVCQSCRPLYIRFVFPWRLACSVAFMNPFDEYVTISLFTKSITLANSNKTHTRYVTKTNLL